MIHSFTQATLIHAGRLFNPLHYAGAYYCIVMQEIRLVQRTRVLSATQQSGDKEGGIERGREV